MTPRRAVDVSALPDHAVGARNPIWWGVMAFIAVEASMFGLLLVSYFYVAGNFDVWPPEQPRAGLPALLGAVLFTASAAPMYFAGQAARREDVRATRRWLVVATALIVAFLGCRVWELGVLPFGWDSHAYGSVVWGLLGMHTLHALVTNCENFAFLALLFTGPVEKSHFGDVEANVPYWYFITGALLVIDAVVYLDPVLRAVS